MATQQEPTEDRRTEEARSFALRKAAAEVAVAAGKKTGRPVDPRVKKLAESR
jgi:hypothetical protein